MSGLAAVLALSAVTLALLAYDYRRTMARADALRSSLASVREAPLLPPPDPRLNPDRAQLAALGANGPPPLVRPMVKPPPAADHFAD